jgi:hypothetical protein
MCLFTSSFDAFISFIETPQQVKHSLHSHSFNSKTILPHFSHLFNFKLIKNNTLSILIAWFNLFDLQKNILLFG